VGALGGKVSRMASVTALERELFISNSWLPIVTARTR
jgi:hypothetical protein